MGRPDALAVQSVNLFPPTTALFHRCYDRKTFFPLGFILLSIVLFVRVSIKKQTMSALSCQCHVIIVELCTENVFVDGLLF